MATVFATGEGAGRRIEFAICAAHDAHIQGGGDWRLVPRSPDPWDYGLELAIDPDDLGGDGSLIVEGDFKVRQSTESMHSSRPESSTILVLEARRWGRPEVDEVQLYLTREQMTRLRKMLSAVVGPEND